MILLEAPGARPPRGPLTLLLHAGRRSLIDCLCWREGGPGRPVEELAHRGHIYSRAGVRLESPWGRHQILDPDPTIDPPIAPDALRGRRNTRGAKGCTRCPAARHCVQAAQPARGMAQNEKPR
jgi:hypothetical protein